MGSGLSQVAGNPQRMTLGGEVVYLSPLTLSDHAEMMDWVQYYPLAEARREIEEAGDLYDEADRRRAIGAARDMVEDIREVRTGSQQDEAIVDRVAIYMDRILNSYRGTQYFLYLSIKKTKPDFQLADVDRLMTPDNHEAIQERMDEVNLGEVRPMTGKKKVCPCPTVGFWKRIGAKCSAILRMLFSGPQGNADS